LPPLLLLLSSGHCGRKEKKKPYLLSLLSLSLAVLAMAVIVVVAGGAGGRRRRSGWGCHASLLSSTLGMRVDVMSVNSAKGERVSWVCTTEGAHRHLSSTALTQPIHVHSWDFEFF